MPKIEIKRRLLKEIRLIEEMLFCFTSQKVINKLIAERDELEEILSLYRDMDSLDVLRDSIYAIYA